MEIKEIKIKPVEQKNEPIVFDTQELFNQSYINDLSKLLKTNTSVPTHVPKKFIDCFYLYWDESTTYELYVYISNSWKKVTLS